MRFSILLLPLVAIASLIAGCGGGGSSATSTVTSAKKTGRVTFSIKWPAHTRLVPYLAQSIAVQIVDPNNPGTTYYLVDGSGNVIQYVPYSDSGSTTVTSQLLPAVAAGTAYTISAQAFTSSNATGTYTASGSLTNVLITPGNTSTIPLTLGTSLSQISVTASQGATNHTVTVQKGSLVQSAALTVVPTLPISLQVTPQNASPTQLTLFPTSTFTIGTASTDTVQIGAGLVSHTFTGATNLLSFTASATASGAGLFNVNYYDPDNTSSANLQASLPVTLTVSPVTTSQTPTLTVPPGGANVTTIEDVTFDPTYGPTYLVLGADANYYLATNLATNVETFGTAVNTTSVSAPTLDAAVGGGVYCYSEPGQTVVGSTLNPDLVASANVVDLDSTPQDTIAYVLNASGGVSKSDGTSITPWITISGATKLTVGTDLNSSSSSNRVIYWLNSSNVLHQTFNNTTAGEPTFGSNAPSGGLAIATANNCPLVFMIVGTSLEAISQTGTVVTTIPLPYTTGSNAVTYTHLAVNVLSSGVITGAAVGSDTAGNQFYVTF